MCVFCMSMVEILSKDMSMQAFPNSVFRGIMLVTQPHMLKAFTPWKLANATQSGPFPLKSQF